MRAVLAYIVERPERAVVSSDHSDRVSGNVRRYEGSRLPCFFDMANPLPRHGDDGFEIRIEPVRIRVRSGLQRFRARWIGIEAERDFPCFRHSCHLQSLNPKMPEVSGFPSKCETAMMPRRWISQAAPTKKIHNFRNPRCEYSDFPGRLQEPRRSPCATEFFFRRSVRNQTLKHGTSHAVCVTITSCCPKS